MADEMNMLARNFEVAHDPDRRWLSDDALHYLARVSGNGWRDDIERAFERADKLNILFVGETIIDEYRYVSPLAKPSKEFILATVESRAPEQFLGGVQAASLHADWRNVKVATDDGEPIRKTRFVDADFGRKLFEVYSKQQVERREDFGFKLDRAVLKADVVVVMDFGHGLLNSADRCVLAGGSFLALNAQTNAGNYGFNPVTKYSRADLVCIDMPEGQLASGHQFEGNADALAFDISRLVNTERVIITQGRNGALCRNGTSSHIPAFGYRAIDTMGAGDAFLAVTAPLVATGLDLEIAAFCGNVAGAIKTDIVGHREHVTRDKLISTIDGLLA